MDVVKGFQVKQPDGSYIFIPENEVYINGSDISQVEKETVLSWMSVKKKNKFKVKNEFPVFKTIVVTSIVILVITLFSFLIRNFGVQDGLMWGFISILTVFFFYLYTLWVYHLIKEYYF
ncbi:hypothetical protein NDS46_30045 (plasmid) [Paenibacillus thiaminolyticus]|uniref:hypothetical protein n=1 Tax=Paenibacillus thiaminolyticus TaxID=49283 RepID=UPI00232BACED|nr:hypothetical protein [Paenibacillus thiaminolyticus]WCF11589.1 hypothetical protein NDS46_30045 [Paenibacillus thiaminolyticus]